MLPEACLTEEKSTDILNVNQLATFIGVSPGWVYRHKDEIPHRQAGSLYFFHLPTIVKWLAGPNVHNSKLNEAAT